MKLDEHLKIKIFLNKKINQKLSKFQKHKVKNYSFKDKKKYLYKNLNNLILEYNSVLPLSKKEILKKNLVQKKIRKKEIELDREKINLHQKKKQAKQKKNIYLKKKNQENLNLEQEILILEGEYLNLDSEMDFETEELINNNNKLKFKNDHNIQDLNYKLRMKKYSKLEIENIRHSLEILKEENKYIDEEEEIKIIDIKKKYDNLKKEYEIKKEIKIYDLEENKKLELEQFNVNNPRIDEIEDYLNYLKSKNFNIKEEHELNKTIIEEKELIQYKINQQLVILNNEIKKEKKLKRYLNQKNLNYNKNIIKMNTDMSWKEKKIDLFDMIKSILDKNPKIKREIRMYKI